MKSAVHLEALTTLIVCLVLLGPASAQAIGSATDGDVTFGYTNNFTTTSGNTVDTQFVGAATGDLTWES